MWQKKVWVWLFLCCVLWNVISKSIVQFAQSKNYQQWFRRWTIYAISQKLFNSQVYQNYRAFTFICISSLPKIVQMYKNISKFLQKKINWLNLSFPIKVINLVIFSWTVTPKRTGNNLNLKRSETQGEKERYSHLNAKFRRIARRDKKTFLSHQCKEIEGKNRMGKTRDPAA